MFILKKIAQSPRTFDAFKALLEEAQGILGVANTVMVNNGLPEDSSNGSYYPSQVTGPETIKAGEEAVYEATNFSLYRGKDEDEEDLAKDKTKIKWIFHMPDVEIKNNLINYIELRGGLRYGQAKIQEDSETDFMDIIDPQKRTEAIMRHGITYIKIEGNETNQKTKLTIKFSKWLDAYKVHIEAYRRTPDVKKEASGATVATTINADPEIIKGYWVNDKKENITNKTVGYKDTVYMCLKTLGMQGKTIITELWEEGITYWWDKSTDHELCMNENVEWKLTDRNSYKKLELPDENDEEYKKQREEITEGEQLELYFQVPSETETKGYKKKLARILKLTTQELISNVYFAKEIKQETIQDGTVQSEEQATEQPRVHIVQQNESLSLIAPKYGLKWRSELAAHNNITAPWTITLGQELQLPDNAIIPESAEANTTQTESQPEAQEETVYEQIDSASLGSEVWLVVETANLHGKKCSIEIYEKDPLLTEKEKPLTVLKDDAEVIKLENITIDDTGKAKVKIKLRKKSDEDYKKQKEKFKDDKIAKLFLKVTCKGDDKTHKKEFLDGDEFEVNKSKRAPWMEIAIQQAKKAKGCKESKKPMYDMAKSYLRFVGNKFEPTDGTYGPWCAAYMNWCINESGYKYAKSASSLAPIHSLYKGTFKKIDKPIYGCIVVYKHNSKWKGHTGFLYGKTKDDKYILLGGNQDNTIKLDDYGEYTSNTKKKKLYGFYIPDDYVVSADDYLTGSDKNLDLKEANKKIGVTSSKSSGQTN